MNPPPGEKTPPSLALSNFFSATYFSYPLNIQIASPSSAAPDSGVSGARLYTFDQLKGCFCRRKCNYNHRIIGVSAVYFLTAKVL